MKVYTYLDDIENMPPSAVALGNFDGVHKGHQALIASCVQKAREEGLCAVVFTFLNHPDSVITGKDAVKNILRIDEKTELIESLGADTLVTAYFTPAIMRLSPDAFVRSILLGTLHMREAFCGFNYSYGYRAFGTPQTLSESGRALGFGVSVLPRVEFEGKTLSSTLLREQIASGDMPGFERATGRHYEIEGKVVPGRHLGHRIGFPTVNLALSEEMALPADGVYITSTYVDGVWRPSITNIGKKPTVGQFERNAETHLFDWDEELYGVPIRVRFFKMLRPEYRFASLQDLQEEIARNCEEARAYHRSRGK